MAGRTDGSRGRPAFVGRDATLATVTDALQRGPALVLVEGEPGIGKSRLIDEMLRSDRLSGCGVLLATCPPVREPYPLGPVVDGARRVAAHLRGGETGGDGGGDVRGDVGALGLTSLGGALRPLFPEWADRLPPALEPLDEPAETRHRLFRALTELIERLGVDVLVLEDAHWADVATLEWLLTATSVADQGMSVVVTYRPADVSPDSLLPRLTSRLPIGMSRVRVALNPLDVEQTRRLIGSMFGTGEVSERFATFVHERTDGIPLAIEESVRLLRERYDIVRHDGGWSRRLIEELEVPPTIRDSVLERVARLPPEARRVLESAAVLAEPAEDDLLIEIADLDDQPGRHGVATALVAGFLREVHPGQYGFRHALDREAVEGATPASERRRLHRRAGEALEATAHASVVRLNRHFREAGDLTRWCHYAERAADLAIRSCDDRAAMTVLLDVLAAVDVDGATRVRLSRKLGEAAAHGYAALGDLGDKAIAALRDVLTQGDPSPDERGELRLLLGRLLMQVGEFDAAYTEIEASLAELRNTPALAARAMMFLAIPLAPTWTAERHLAWLERAAPRLSAIQPAWERLSCVADRAMILLLLGRESGWDVAARLPRSAPTRPELQEIARGRLNVGQYAITWGRYGEADRYLTDARDLAAAIDFRRLTVAVDVARALLDWYAGRWNGLRARVVDLVEADDAKQLTRTEARLVQGLLDLATGERAAARGMLRGVLDEITRRGFAEPGTTVAAAALGRLHLGDGEPEKAIEVTMPVVEVIDHKGVWLWAADIAPVSCRALVEAGHVDRAELLTDAFAAGLADLTAPAPQAALATCRAILAEARGTPRDAAGQFAAAAVAWAALPRPYDESLALERRGLNLLAAAERDDGVAQLIAVESRLRDLGARWDADRVAQALRRHGVGIARTWRRGPRGYGNDLSPREREVLALIARGLTNREAAAALFLSPKTVGRHLGTAMRKLGVSTRTGAVMTAAEAGLLEPGDGRTDRAR